MRTQPDELLLTTFVRDVYLADFERRQGRPYSHGYQLFLRNTLDYFSEAIKTAPRVRDLNDANLAKMKAYMVQNGYAQATIESATQYLTLFWRIAIAKGYLVHGVASKRQNRIGGGPCANPPLTGADGTLWNLCEKTYFKSNVRIRSILTRHQYRIALKSFKRFLGHEPTLADLQDDLLTAWLVTLRDDEGLSARTCNERVGRLVTLHTWCAKRRLVEMFPTVVRMQEPRRIPEAWTMDEMHRLCRAASQVSGYVGDIPACDWWLALMLVLLNSGARIGEIREAEWRHLNWQTGFLYVPAEVRKGGQQDMKYKLHNDTLAVLCRVKNAAGQQRLIFHWPLHPGHLWCHYAKVVKAAGLPAGRGNAFHKIRRTVASYLQAAGIDACMALRHSTPSVTIESYLDPSICGGKNAADVLPMPSFPALITGPVNGKGGVA